MNYKTLNTNNEELQFNFYTLLKHGYRLINIILLEKNNEEFKILYLFDRNNCIEGFCIIRKIQEGLDSISEFYPAAVLIEEEINKHYGIKINNLNKDLIFKYDRKRPNTAISKIPFGPLNGFFDEPLQLKVSLEDDEVLKIDYSGEYAHRGIEEYLKNKNINTGLKIAGRVCGKNSAMHSLAYCQAVENIFNIEVPKRSEFLRVIFGEISRIQSHLYNIAMVSSTIGFESLSMEVFKIREHVLGIIEQIGGNRIITNYNIIGGVQKNIDKDNQFEINFILGEVKYELKRIVNTFESNLLIKSRLQGTGVLKKEDALRLGVTGIAARASGILQDIRLTKYAAYGYLDFKPVTISEGDAYARTILRFEEVYQSIDLIEQSIEIMPEGEFIVKDKIDSYNVQNTVEHISRVEEAGGELAYYLGINSCNLIKAVSIRNSTGINWAALISSLKSSSLEDLPAVIASFDLSISGMEK